MDRFNRTCLLFGNRTLDKLQKSTVMVVGCGAVGSFAIEGLCRTGVGKLILVDSDVIEESNINRQLFATTKTVGVPKVDVASKRILEINPDANVTALQMFFDDASVIDATPDFVIDAIDTVKSKMALYRWCIARGIDFISSMGAAMKTDISKIKFGNIYDTTVCPLAATVRRMARAENLPNFPVVYSVESPMNNPESADHVFGSAVTTTGTFGLMMAQYVINYLTNR